MPEHSLFFAIMPDWQTAAIAHALASRLQRAERLTGAPRPTETLHVSLFPIALRTPDPPSEEAISGAERAAARVKARAFVASLNRAESWTRGRARGPAVLVGEDGVIGIDYLHRAIARAHGREPNAHFNAHMSLAWSAGEFAPVYVEPLTWAVRDFALVHSLVGLSRYEILARFPLADPGSRDYADAVQSAGA